MSINAGEIFGPGEPSDEISEFKLRSMICYYGKHYATFIFNADGSWTYYDDTIVTPKLTWDAVMGKCKSSRWQPQLLVFERTTALAATPSMPATIAPATTSGAAASASTGNGASGSTVINVDSSSSDDDDDFQSDGNDGDDEDIDNHTSRTQRQTRRKPQLSAADYGAASSNASTFGRLDALGASHYVDNVAKGAIKRANDMSSAPPLCMPVVPAGSQTPGMASKDEREAHLEGCNLFIVDPERQFGLKLYVFVFLWCNPRVLTIDGTPSVSSLVDITPHPLI